MSLIAVVAVYFVLWWLVLLAVLPWGMRTQEEEGEIVLGTAHSAPVRPMLVKKVIATSIVTAILVGVLWFVTDTYGLSVWTVADWFDLRQ